MLKGLIGKKVGMTRLFIGEGRAVPVTVLKVGPCRVVQIKTPEKDNTSSVQLGYGVKKARRVNKPLAGHYAQAGVEPAAVLGEFKVDDPGSFEVGQEITAEIFSQGDKVRVTGTSKGRGFTGVVKRHGFSGGPATHGCTTHDKPGSIGHSADPSKVFKGKKMPGRHGGKKRTVKNMQVVDVRPEMNLVMVKGAVPGPGGGIVFLNKVS